MPSKQCKPERIEYLRSMPCAARSMSFGYVSSAQHVVPDDCSEGQEVGPRAAKDQRIKRGAVLQAAQWTPPAS
jgi:hypothetical protein